MIKSIIFDVGGVLIRTHNRSGRVALERQYQLEEWQSDTLVFTGQTGTRAQLGEISDDALWATIATDLNLSPAELASFQEQFWSGDRLDEGLVHYIRQLRPNYKTAIISNATDALRRRLNEEYPIADAFDLIVCSAEEGIMKPDPRIYELALTRLGCHPEESVFVDDALPNVQAARALGMHAVHYQPGMDVPAALERHGVIVGDSQ